MVKMKSFIPTYWSELLLHQLIEEDKVVEKIKKAKLTEEQKINAI